jgi:methionyl-tRNA synthetase
MYLWPIVPRFSEQAADVIGSNISSMDSTTLFGERDRPLGTFQRMFERIDHKAIEKMLEATKANLETQDSKKAAAKEASAGGTKGEITFEQFQELDLRVGEVVAAEPVKKSKKLLRLEVNVGEETPRQIVAGIAMAYTPEQLIGTRVVVVANLKPAKLMGVESRGMVLAAGDGNGLAVLRLDKDQPPGTRVR